MRVTFEQAVERRHPLSLRLQGDLPANLALSSELGMNPEAVVVRGPESRISGLDSIPLMPLDLGRVRDSDVLTLAVDTSGLGGATVVPTDVMVGVRVEPMVERDLEGVVVHADVRGSTPAVTVDPPSIRLRLAGARTLVIAMDLSLLRVSVLAEDLVGMTPGEARRVRVHVDGVPPLVRISPSTDVVIVRQAGTQRDDEEQDPS
jgi:hypothetical protein